jgi:hypothetical protein
MKIGARCISTPNRRAGSPNTRLTRTKSKIEPLRTIAFRQRWRPTQAANPIARHSRPFGTVNTNRRSNKQFTNVLGSAASAEQFENVEDRKVPFGGGREFSTSKRPNGSGIGRLGAEKGDFCMRGSKVAW